jgi:hypothetical protein
MDTWGFVLIGIGGLTWLISSRRNEKLAAWARAFFFIGVGIVIGSVGSYLIITSLF